MQTLLLRHGFKWIDDTTEVFHPFGGPSYTLHLDENKKISCDSRRIAKDCCPSSQEFLSLFAAKYGMELMDEDKAEIIRVFYGEVLAINADIVLDSDSTGTINYKNKIYKIEKIITFIKLYEKMKPIFDAFINKLANIEKED